MVAEKLRSGLAEMQISATGEQTNQLHTYLELLVKWNQAYNLTAISDPTKMVSYHVLDSLSLFDLIENHASCLDVGTGAGLPGIPLAIMRPETHWVLLDSNGKKTRFVQQVIASCRLSNVKVVQSRVQDYHADSLFDIIVSRAYASVEDFIASVNHLWHKDKILITMKTEMSSPEREALASLPYKVEVTPITVPGIDEKRSLVLIQRQNT